MSKRSKFTVEEKCQILQEYKKREMTIRSICHKYGVSDSSLYNWERKFDQEGIAGLQSLSKNKAYSSELKIQAVEEYLQGGGSHQDIAYKYGISSKTQLMNWIKKYNGHEKLTSYRPGVKIVTKRRKTTLAERIEITQYCIIHDYSYQETAEKYHVSYQQVYQWVKKYEKDGEMALEDGRGRKKAEEELSEFERQRLDNLKLKQENERLKLEVAFLKKLEEIERSRC